MIVPIKSKDPNCFKKSNENVDQDKNPTTTYPDGTYFLIEQTFSNENEFKI